MAMVMEQQQRQQQQQQGEYKHYCRVCKKGFGCGRALGGHMRAHGIGDEGAGGQRGDNDDDDSGEEWDDKNGAPPGSRRMYALRANPNRLKSCRVCENCGEEFASWKSFLEHGRCSSDDDGAGGGRSVVSSPRSDAEEDAGGARECAAWSKGKRSRRTKVAAIGGGAVVHQPSSEEEDLANCLVMLSAARFDPMAVVAEAEESCASASKDEDSVRRHHHPPADPFSAASNKHKAPTAAVVPAGAPRGMFECKACKKVFTSHQALGGHRASHKKVKGCFAAKLDDLDEPPPPEEEPGAGEALMMAIVPFENAPLSVTPLKRKSRVHECSICHRVFASGQALGGHKRCHWLTANAPEAGSLAKIPIAGAHQHLETHQLHLRPMFECSEPPLDLNLPAPTDDLAAVRQDIGSSLRLDVPASIYIQSWADHSHNNNSNNNNNAATMSNNNHNNNEALNPTVDDEADSKVKLAKLSELKDMNVGGDTSPWLQVGIGSSTNESSEP